MTLVMRFARNLQSESTSNIARAAVNFFKEEVHAWGVRSGRSEEDRSASSFFGCIRSRELVVRYAAEKMSSLIAPS